MRHERDMAPSGSILPLRLDGVRYAPEGVPLLSDISLTVAPFRRLVVLGPNGAGKSILLRLCHGLLAPSAGRLSWAADPSRPGVQGMVLQRPVMLRRSVAENLDYPLALSGQPRAQRRARVAETLAHFGLEPMASRPARLLSGGEQQRLALARAWAMRPQLLFLDEPSSALDPAATRSIEEMILGFSAEGITIVMTSHDLGQVRRLAEDVAFLHRGRLVEAGPAGPFLDGPRTAEARAFLAGELIW